MTELSLSYPAGNVASTLPEPHAAPSPALSVVSKRASPAGFANCAPAGERGEARSAPAMPVSAAPTVAARRSEAWLVAAEPARRPKVRIDVRVARAARGENRRGRLS